MEISFHTQSLPAARLIWHGQVDELYVALTGDQCALTNIRFKQIL